MLFGRLAYRIGGLTTIILLVILVGFPTVLFSAEGKLAPPFVNDPVTVKGYFDAVRSDNMAYSQTDSVSTGTFDIRNRNQAGTLGKSKKDVKKAFIYSLLLPGAGQLYVGSKTKAAAFFGIEVLAWTGKFLYDAKGDDKTDEFNRFADTYWSEERYDDFLEMNYGVRDDDFAYWYCEPDSGLVFGHHLPDTKTQQYYEMIGKYDQFVFGWADVPPLTAEDTTIYKQTVSQLRLTYEDMRHDANSMYDRATAALIVVMINHVISAGEAALAAKRHNNGIDEMSGPLSFRAKLAKIDERRFPMITMTYRF